MLVKLTFFLTACLSLNINLASANELDLDQEIIDNSPLFERWLQEIPNVLEDIKHEPRFSTRFRFGYNQYTSTEDSAGWLIGVEDLWIGETPLSLNALYQGSFSGNRTALATQFQYYLLPLGNFINVAPVIGYRYLQSEDYSTTGVNLGARLVLALSATGASDIFIQQSFILPFQGQQVGITTFSFSYSLSPQLRLSTDIELENSVAAKDTRFAVLLEITP